MLIPTRCPVCNALGPAPCARCAAELRHAPALPPPAGLASFRALLRYEDAGRELLARLKYRNARATIVWLAVQLAGLVPAELVTLVPVVTWAPTSPARRRERGFDQAELLARAVAGRLDLPCRRLLDRGPGPPQTGQSADARRRGPPFLARPPRGSGMPVRVLLTDDVVTTGATMESAARALRAAGAAEIHGLAAGRTPRKSARSRDSPASPSEAQL